MNRPNVRGENCTRALARKDARSLVRRARATLRHVRFPAGFRSGRIEISPALTQRQVRELRRWLERLPEGFERALPPLKIAAADHLYAVRHSVFIDENPLPAGSPAREYTHAVSFIPERYIVLSASLFRRRIELGRILYHELCHFLWPRLGNPRRRKFHALLSRELRDGVRGELGYSSEYRKKELARRNGFRRSPFAQRRRTLDYVCESFCDTGSFVLLGDERRKEHSEYSLSLAAQKRRSRLWRELALGRENGSDCSG